jgi:hypothetical protein
MLKKCLDELRTQLTTFGYYTYNGLTSLGQIQGTNYGKGAVLFVLGEELTDDDETTIGYLTNNIAITFLISVQCNENTFIDNTADSQTEFKLFINNNVYLNCEAMEFEYISSDFYVDNGGQGSYGGIAVTTNLRYRQLKSDPTNK